MIKMDFSPTDGKKLEKNRNALSFFDFFLRNAVNLQDKNITNF
jgi:hypothetical protein